LHLFNQRLAQIPVTDADVKRQSDGAEAEQVCAEQHGC